MISMQTFLDALRQVAFAVVLTISMVTGATLIVVFFHFFKGNSPEENRDQGLCSCGNCHVMHLPRSTSFKLGIICRGCQDNIYIYDLED